MTATKTAPKTAKTPKTEAAPKTEKPGLRKPQVRVLQLLAKAKTPLTRVEISQKAGVDLAALTEYVGSEDAEKRAKNDAKFMSLVSLGYVKHKKVAMADGTEKTAHELTAAGRKAAEKAAKAE